MPAGGKPVRIVTEQRKSRRVKPPSGWPRDRLAVDDEVERERARSRRVDDEEDEPEGSVTSNAGAGIEPHALAGPRI
jgi:hypothetical protein